MIPQFPIFKKLAIDDKKAIEAITHNFLPYSDYNFVSLWAYNTQEAMEISILSNNLVIKFTDYTTSKDFYSFIGTNDIHATITALFDLADKQDIIKELKLIPDICIQSAQKILMKDFIIAEDEDNFDYILSVNNLCDENDRIHYNKRKQIKIFKELYPNYKVVTLNPKDPAVQSEILTLFTQWENQKGKDKKETKQEFTAIQRTINYADILEIYASGIYNDNALVGFAIADSSFKNYGDFHFVKGTALCEGIYAMLYITLAQHLQLTHYEFMNIEQDLGDLKLREAKKQWHPISYLKKYKISPR